MDLPPWRNGMLSPALPRDVLGATVFDPWLLMARAGARPQVVPGGYRWLSMAIPAADFDAALMGLNKNFSQRNWNKHMQHGCISANRFVSAGSKSNISGLHCKSITTFLSEAAYS